jgi:hypothetical protein
MNKVIFLDIDGVLNCNSFLYSNNRCDREDVEMIDPSLILKLNRIIKETGANVVISSSWRIQYNHKQLQEMFDKIGFIGNVVGQTIYSIFDRGYEIIDYLRNNDVDKFVILDDNDIFDKNVNGEDEDIIENIINHFVKTDCEIGISDSDVNLAINILN